MRPLARTGLLLLATAGPTAAHAQIGGQFGGDFALTYQWVRTNTPSGQCGCFDVNGGGVSASVHLLPRISAVGEVSSEYATKVQGTTQSLTLTTYLAGARLRLPRLPIPILNPEPFVQGLAGEGHAGGGIAGAGDHTYAFAARFGGGIDIPLGALAIRLIQVDYFPTKFNNAGNNQQSNLLLGAGLVYRWRK